MKKVAISASGRALGVAEVADNPWTRAVGLLGRKGLPDGSGLWIKPCKSVHTFFMRFPVDLVYLSSDGMVVKTRPGVRPFRFSAGGRKSHSVLEFAAGFLDQVRLQVGERLFLSLAPEDAPASSADPGPDQTREFS